MACVQTQSSHLFLPRDSLGRDPIWLCLPGLWPPSCALASNTLVSLAVRQQPWGHLPKALDQAEAEG